MIRTSSQRSILNRSHDLVLGPDGLPRFLPSYTEEILPLSKFFAEQNDSISITRCFFIKPFAERRGGGTYKQKLMGGSGPEIRVRRVYDAVLRDRIWSISQIGATISPLSY